MCVCWWWGVGGGSRKLTSQLNFTLSVSSLFKSMRTPGQGPDICFSLANLTVAPTNSWLVFCSKVCHFRFLCHRVAKPLAVPLKQCSHRKPLALSTRTQSSAPIPACFQHQTIAYIGWWNEERIILGLTPRVENVHCGSSVGFLVCVSELRFAHITVKPGHLRLSGFGFAGNEANTLERLNEFHCTCVMFLGSKWHCCVSLGVADGQISTSFD